MKYDEKTREVLAKNIWRRRELLGISRAELENKVGVSGGMVSKWERGVSTPSKENIRALSKALKCSMNDLVSEHRMAVISFTENKIVEQPVIEKIEEDMQLGFDANVGYVSARLDKYMRDNKITYDEMGDKTGVSKSSIWKLRNNRITTYSEPVKQVEKYLNDVESKKEEVVVEPIKEPVKTEVLKGSISDRLTTLYDTLFNTLAELDELREDIAKIEKVTTLLKQIDL